MVYPIYNQLIGQSCPDMSSKKRGLEAEAMLNRLTNKKFKKDVKANIESKGSEEDNKKTRSKQEEEVKMETKKENKKDDNKTEKFKAFKEALQKATDDDIDWEFLCFMKQLPTTLPEETRMKWIKTVRKHLKIMLVKKRIRKTPRRKEFTTTILDQTPVLDAMSALIGMSWRILAPPTSSCLLCKRSLTIHHDPTQVKLHTRIGSLISSKYILRCRDCSNAPKHVGLLFGAPEDIHYHATR